MKALFLLVLSAVLACAETPASTAGAQLLSVAKISDQAPHSAFTDLVRYQNLYFCAFRESAGHVGGEGKIRILMSFDASRWRPAALLEQKGIDLRDPKLEVTKEGRLICFMGGSEYEGTTIKARRSRVATSTDGQHWSPIEKSLNDWDWLWQVAMHPTEKCFYGTVYNTRPVDGGAKEEAEWTLKLMKSADGKIWQLVSPFNIKGRPSEATARVLANGDMMVLVRRDAPGMNKGMIGVARAPYHEWTFTELQVPLGGPNFVQLPDGRLIAGSRGFGATPGAHMILSEMTATGLKPILELPSGGDCSYPGMVVHEGKLVVSYYSSHEGKTSVYLAKVQP
jgi:hypothetical protein